MSKPQLFHKQMCPYSKKVRDYIDARELRSQIEYRDIEADPGARDQLLQLSGRTQVPCLEVNGKPILESDDIIQWLQANLVDPTLGPNPGWG